MNQQYALNLKGGGDKHDYFFSVGYDNVLNNLVGNKNERVTLNSNYNFRPAKNLTFSVGLNFIQGSFQNNSVINDIKPGISKQLFPYAQLAEINGNSLAIVRDYNSNYLDTVGNGKLLDWKYKPLDETKNINKTNNLTENRVNLGIKYNFLKNFSTEVKYQFYKSTTRSQNYYNDSTYFARNTINKFSLISGNTITRPVPLGSILDQINNYSTSHRGRFQLNYNNSWGQRHKLISLAGAEISQVINETNSYTTYGYSKNNGTFRNVNYDIPYQQNPSGAANIPSGYSISKFTDRYISYFGNAAYTFNDRYTFSVSGRIDKSNLFGVDINQKSIPLYSVGSLWDISKEHFYKLPWLPLLKLRVTYGYNGNVDKSVTAYTTIQQLSNSFYYGLPYANISNPGNPELRWEKIRMLNFGLDFSFRNNILSGSLEYYLKNGIDLISNSPLPTSTGLSSYRGNTANTEGHGFDIVINSRNFSTSNFKWTTNFICSYALDKVTKYDVKYSTLNYVNLGAGLTGNIMPLVGKPIFAIYSYKWAGLNPNTGAPQGYLNKTISVDYANIIKTPIDSVVFNGTSRPTTFGSIGNSLYYKRLSLSFNVTYKLNYYFRRTSINYSLLINNWGGHKDFASRWKIPGDEAFTNVPSIQYPPLNANRETFYQLSEVLVEKGDHIRLQDISISYDIIKSKKPKTFISDLQVYGYVNNVTILWRANKQHLDPDVYSTNLPNPRTYSIGIKANF